MSIKSIIELNKIYKLYLTRRLLNLGLLKSKLVRIVLISIFIALLSIFSISGYLFINQVANDEQAVLLLIKAFITSSVMWTITVVLALKVIFSKSQDFFKIMENFPINNKVKNLSIFIFESLCSLAVVFCMCFSFIIAIILSSPTNYLGYLVVNIFYVSAITYLLLQLISKIISISCVILKIEKLYSLINISALVLVFIIAYKQTEPLVKSLINDYLNNKNSTKSVFLLFNEIYQHSGLLLTTLIFLILFSGLSLIMFILPDNSYYDQSKYINVFKSIKRINVFKTYLLSIVRDKNVLSNIIGTYIFAILLLSINLDKYILFALLLVVFHSIYCFVQTLRIRLISYSINYSVIKDYILMVFSQLAVTYITSIPLLIISICLNGANSSILTPYYVITVGTFILVMAGILFPPYNDNPFSILVSLIIISVPLLFILLIIILFNLGLKIIFGIFIAMFIFVICFSILALKNTEKRSRNETLNIFN
ncbi:TPA: hypothetical protein PP875_002609 [Staphylococcus aureus]|nr:hypothetical protein [Staphylococcus aureus]HDJ2986166.1 hypothetical protein [Staphylococcus aureus]HDJ3185590.1 hypothetical protein [Staphylococcus aureus]